MKRTAILIISLLLAAPLWAQQTVDFPEQQVGAVTDHFEVVDRQTEERIQQLADQLRQVTSINLVVAVIRTTRPMDSERYGRELYRRWDVGQSDEGLDHGVLIMLAILDREVKIIPGRQVEFLFPTEVKEQMEMNLYPLLGEGKISQATFSGAAEVTRYILTEWPKYHSEGRRLDPTTVSRVIFALTIISLFLTLIYGLGFLAFFATLAGGSFGYIFFGIPGLLLGAAIGFFLNFGRKEQRPGQAEREMNKLYREWKEEKTGKEEKDDQADA